MAQSKSQASSCPLCEDGSCPWADYDDIYDEDLPLEQVLANKLNEVADYLETAADGLSDADWAFWDLGTEVLNIADVLSDLGGCEGCGCGGW